MTRQLVDGATGVHLQLSENPEIYFVNLCGLCSVHGELDAAIPDSEKVPAYTRDNVSYEFMPAAANSKQKEMGRRLPMRKMPPGLFAFVVTGR
jgi:hypothetical protein